MTYLLIFIIGFISGFGLLAMARDVVMEKMERDLKVARQGKV